MPPRRQRKWQFWPQLRQLLPSLPPSPLSTRPAHGPCSAQGATPRSCLLHITRLFTRVSSIHLTSSLYVAALTAIAGSLGDPNVTILLNTTGELQKKVKDLEQNVEDLEQRVEDLEHDLDEALDDQDAHIERMSAQLEEVLQDLGYVPAEDQEEHAIAAAGAAGEE